MFLCFLCFSIIYVLSSFLISLSSLTKIILVTSGIESILYFSLLVIFGLLVLTFLIYIIDIVKKLLIDYKKNKHLVIVYFIPIFIALISKLFEFYYLAY